MTIANTQDSAKNANGSNVETINPVGYPALEETKLPAMIRMRVLGSQLVLRPETFSSPAKKSCEITASRCLAHSHLNETSLFCPLDARTGPAAF